MMTNNNRSAIWIKLSVLDSAVTKARSPRRTPSRKAFNSIAKEYDWIFAYMLHNHENNKVESGEKTKSDINDEEIIFGSANARKKNTDSDLGITVLVEDESCPRHNGNTIQIPKMISDPLDYIHDPFYVKADIIQQHLPPNDLMNLTHLNEPSMVQTLHKQYQKDVIYTTAGRILISLNPFKPCYELYNDESMQRYWEKGEKEAALASVSTSTISKKQNGNMPQDQPVDEDSHSNDSDSNKSEYHIDQKPKDKQTTSGIFDENKLPPHIFSIADHAFRSMMEAIKYKRGDCKETLTNNNQQENLDEHKIGQSILISGESGAGKTFSTKIILRYIATLSERSAQQKQKNNSTANGIRNNGLEIHDDSIKTGSKIEQKVIHANPLLQSLGNARTLRNDNSSRFGKFVELQFKDTGFLIGAEIQTYLLEKVRLVHQQPGERNFHIFYELLDGITNPSERIRFELHDYTAKDFKLTSMSGTYNRRDGVKDSVLFSQLRNAMNILGFPVNEQYNIFSLACATMHASNVNFQSIDEEGSEVDFSNPSIGAVLSLFGFDGKAFNKAVCSHEVTVGKESYFKLYSIQKSHKALEALMKAVYHALFRYVVDRINQTMSLNKMASSVKGMERAGYIGVVDIFGFESFQTNSFEQLCINYCNEVLQQQFNYSVFSNDQKEYEKEGINCSFLKYPDNNGILELIDKPTKGIMAILNDHCKVASGTDSTFVGAIYDQCIKHANFSVSARQEWSNLFGILHYAGPVEYNAEGFIEKNKDEFPKAGAKLLSSSSQEFVKTIATYLTKTTFDNSAGKRAKKQNNNMTVGAQFIKQLQTLRSRISTTNPHYIRCFKPNNMLVEGNFDPAIVVSQLRCSGVIESLNISRIGYTGRFSHAEFLRRYRILDFTKFENENGSEIVTLVNAVKEHVMKNNIGRSQLKSVDAGRNTGNGIQMGKGKVFLNSDVLSHLDRLRGQKLELSLLLIQTWCRKTISRKRYRRIRNTFISLQHYIRIFLAIKRKKRNEKYIAATVIQKAYRMVIAKRTYLMMLYIKHQITDGSRKPMSQTKSTSSSPKQPANAIPPIVLRRMRRLARDEKSSAISDLAIGAFYFGLKASEYLTSPKKVGNILTLQSIDFYVQNRKLFYPELAKATQVAISLPSHSESAICEHAITVKRSIADPFLCPVQAWIRVATRILGIAGTSESTPINIYFNNNRKQSLSIFDMKGSIAAAVTSIGAKSVGFSPQEAEKKSFRIRASQRESMLKILKT